MSHHIPPPPVHSRIPTLRRPSTITSTLSEEHLSVLLNFLSPDDVTIAADLARVMQVIIDGRRSSRRRDVTGEDIIVCAIVRLLSKGLLASDLALRRMTVQSRALRKT